MNIRFRKSAPHWFAFATAIASRVALATPAMQADVVAVLATRIDIRAHTQACAMRPEVPADGRFRWAESIWESGNLAAFREAELYIEAQAASEQASLNANITAEAESRATWRKRASTLSLGATDASACVALWNQLANYAGRHDLFGDGLYARLEAAYSARRGAEGLRRELQREDMRVGCVKGQLRAGRTDFDALRSSCECVIKALTDSASQDQIDTYLRLSGSDAKAATDYVYKTPSMAAALPRMRDCASKGRPP